jgi:hypothetical protein
MMPPIPSHAVRRGRSHCSPGSPRTAQRSSGGGCLLQPFFLLILMPVMGAGVRIQARDVVGYLFVPFLVIFSLIGLLVALVPV